jgi:hypothetical protein
VCASQQQEINQQQQLWQLMVQHSFAEDCSAVDKFVGSRFVPLYIVLQTL